MTPEQIKSAFAARLWKAQAEDAGTPQGVIDARTPEHFADQGDAVRSHFIKYAAAVYELGKPKPLVWVRSARRTQFAICSYSANSYNIEQRSNGTDFDLWVGHDATEAIRGKSLEAAQAAAKSHADAAHWATRRWPI